MWVTVCGMTWILLAEHRRIELGYHHRRREP